MAKYDTTGPVTINERASLIYLLALLGVVGVGAWLGLELRELASRPTASPVPVAVAPSASAAAIESTTRRADDFAEGVNRLNDGTAVVKAGDIFVQIVQSERSVWSLRMPPRDNPDLAERWRFANIASAIGRDPHFAERFDAADVAEKLRGLNLRPPHLTPTQVNALRDLYLASQDAGTAEERARADQALHDAVAAMPITPEEQQSFDNAVDAAHALLSPHQLELIRTGGKKEVPAAPKGSTRTAAPPHPGSPAPTTTSHPAPAQKGPG